jgi:hypothetical protein
MSYVGISGDLITNVENHISRMRNKEREAFTTPKGTLELDEAPQEVVALLWGCLLYTSDAADDIL